MPDQDPSQRRQPVSYTELQEVLRTGTFPAMADPVKPGDKPFCYNCAHWQANNDFTGTCSNIAARRFAIFANLEFGSGPVRYTTGGLCHCPLHEHPSPLP